MINDHEVFPKTYLCEYRGNMLSVCPPHNLLMSLESNQRSSRGYSLFQSVREKPLKPRGWNEIRSVVFFKHDKENMGAKLILEMKRNGKGLTRDSIANEGSW